jgi:heme/copper-type cytochrome/quinol oxidase subunit 1
MIAMNNAIGNWLIILGLALVIFGIIAKTGVFGWFGHLPLDLHIKREGFQFYFPLGSMIVISIVLSLCISVLRKLL